MVSRRQRRHCRQALTYWILLRVNFFFIFFLFCLCLLQEVWGGGAGFQWCYRLSHWRLSMCPHSCCAQQGKSWPRLAQGWCVLWAEVTHAEEMTEIKLVCMHVLQLSLPPSVRILNFLIWSVLMPYYVKSVWPIEREKFLIPNWMGFRSSFCNTSWRQFGQLFCPCCQLRKNDSIMSSASK